MLFQNLECWGRRMVKSKLIETLADSCVHNKLVEKEINKA